MSEEDRNGELLLEAQMEGMRVRMLIEVLAKGGKEECRARILRRA